MSVRVTMSNAWLARVCYGCARAGAKWSKLCDYPSCEPSKRIRFARVCCDAMLTSSNLIACDIRTSGD
eukprot:3724487-Amphidinium_carterae.1